MYSYPHCSQAREVLSRKKFGFPGAVIEYLLSVVEKYGILIDSSNELTMVYWFEKGIMEQFSFGEDTAVGIYDDFFIRIS